MSTKTNVSTATVRAWAKENLSSIPAEGHVSILGKNLDGVNVRGRLHPTVTEAFNKAHSKSRKVYVEKAGEARTVTFDVAVKNKAGAWRKSTVTLTTGEARVLLGHPEGRRGRMSREALAMAYANANGLPVKESEAAA